VAPGAPHSTKPYRVIGCSDAANSFPPDSRRNHIDIKKKTTNNKDNGKNCGNTELDSKVLKDTTKVVDSLDALGLGAEDRSSLQANPVRNSTTALQQPDRTQAAERTSALKKKKSSLLAKIHATLEDMKVPLGRVKTPGLQELFDNLSKQFAEYYKAHNETCREWR